MPRALNKTGSRKHKSTKGTGMPGKTAKKPGGVIPKEVLTKHPDKAKKRGKKTAGSRGGNPYA